MTILANLIGGFLILTFGLAVFMAMCRLVYGVWLILYDGVCHVYYTIRGNGGYDEYAMLYTWNEVKE